MRATAGAEGNHDSGDLQKMQQSPLTGPTLSSLFIYSDGVYGCIALGGNEGEDELPLGVGLESCELLHDAAVRLRSQRRQRKVIKKRASIQVDI